MDELSEEEFRTVFMPNVGEVVALALTTNPHHTVDETLAVVCAHAVVKQITETISMTCVETAARRVIENSCVLSSAEDCLTFHSAFASNVPNADIVTIDNNKTHVSSTFLHTLRSLAVEDLAVGVGIGKRIRGTLVATPCIEGMKTWSTFRDGSTGSLFPICLQYCDTLGLTMGSDFSIREPFVSYVVDRSFAAGRCVQCVRVDAVSDVVVHRPEVNTAALPEAHEMDQAVVQSLQSGAIPRGLQLISDGLQVHTNRLGLLLSNLSQCWLSLGQNEKAFAYAFTATRILGGNEKAMCRAVKAAMGVKGQTVWAFHFALEAERFLGDTMSAATWDELLLAAGSIKEEPVECDGVPFLALLVRAPPPVSAPHTTYTPQELHELGNSFYSRSEFAAAAEKYTQAIRGIVGGYDFLGARLLTQRMTHASYVLRWFSVLSDAHAVLVLLSFAEFTHLQSAAMEMVTQSVQWLNQYPSTTHRLAVTQGCHGRGIRTFTRIAKSETVVMMGALAVASFDEAQHSRVMNIQEGFEERDMALVSALVALAADSPLHRLQLHTMYSGKADEPHPLPLSHRLVIWSRPSLFSLTLDSNRIRRIVAHNSFEPAGPGSYGVWVLSSFFNHSRKDMNVKVVFGAKGLMRITALRDIEPEEELLVQYFSNDQETADWNSRGITT